MSTSQPHQQRLPLLLPDSMDAKQKDVLNAILSGPRGNLNGPFLAWIHSPELADHAQKLGAYCRYQSGLPLKLSELAILVTAYHWRCQAEWHIHLPIAIQAGLNPELTEQLRTGVEPEFADTDERLIWRFATELYQSKRVSDTIYLQMKDRFGLDVVVNAVGLLGYYALVAMTLNVFNMRGEGQTTLPFPD